MEVKTTELPLQQGPEKKGLFQKVRAFYAEPPVSEKKLDGEAVKKTYPKWRLRIFLAAFVGYVTLYLCKKNIAAALPIMSTQLHYSNTELGILGSSLYLTYAVGKFVNGVLADGSNVRKFMPSALIFSAIANLCFAASFFFFTPGKFTLFGLPSATILLWAFAFFWGLNGWFQSMGFPAAAKTLTYWFSSSERGTKWALWSTSHQTGTFLSVLISGVIISHYGWKAAFYMPAILAIVVSGWLINRLRDKPTSLGLPDIEEYREPEKAVIEKKNEDAEANDSYGQIFKKYILCNKTIWLLAIAYIFVYVIRFGTEDWIIKYMVEFKKDSIETASMKLSFLPLFGIAGTILAGYLSDKVFKGKRGPINLIYLAGVVVCMTGLYLNGAHPLFADKVFTSLTHLNMKNLINMTSSQALDFILIGMTGFCTYGPQMLIGGLCAVESSSRKVASAATGFTGSFGYIGAVISGVGTGMVVDKFGWNGALVFWATSAVICMAICLPMCFTKKTKEA